MASDGDRRCTAIAKSTGQRCRRPRAEGKTVCTTHIEGAVVLATDESKRCTAMSKRTGERCGHWKVPGKQVCHYHGGKSTGAPKNNKNAVTTGEYESILLDTMTPDEQVLFAQANVDKLHALDEQIRLALIRERRMMQRIAKLADVPMTIVEMSYKYNADADDEGLGDALPIAEYSEKRRGALGQIQNIEEALTRLQAQLRQMIVDKHRIETGAPPDGEELDALFDNMRRSRTLAEKGGGRDGH